ncbi:MAG: transposase [Candidatus Binatia bacterium]
MKYNPNAHHRRSIRLKGYNYKQPGAYFVTICTQDRACLFGNVADDKMQLNDAGRMVQHWWFELNRKFPTVETDEFVVMPNHFHGIVVMSVRADLRVGPVSDDAHAAHQGAHTGAPLPRIIQWFKIMTTNEYIRCVKTESWPSFNRQLWQRNYYEHVVRNDDSLNRIRQYIVDNPARWAFDRENPAATALEPEDAWLASTKPSSTRPL